MLIGRQSVTNRRIGGVAFGTEPIARMQWGSLCVRSTYSKLPALNHSASTRMSTSCAYGSSSHDL